jgi:hypothetical protein
MEIQTEGERMASNVVAVKVVSCKGERWTGIEQVIYFSAAMVNVIVLLMIYFPLPQNVDEFT